MNDLMPVLKDSALYLCDNGACYCGEHAGTSARYTGRDLSGQPVERITETAQRWMEREHGRRFKCEVCSARERVVS